MLLSNSSKITILKQNQKSSYFIKIKTKTENPNQKANAAVQSSDGLIEAKKNVTTAIFQVKYV